MNILRKISRRSHVYLLPALLIILASYQVERLQIAETPKKIVLPRPVRHNLEQLDVDEIIEACTHPKVIPNTPFKFKMDVENFHLVEHSTPYKTFLLGNCVKPDTPESAAGNPGHRWFKCLQLFCLSNFWPDTPIQLDFDMIVAYMEFGNMQGIVVVFEKHPWSFRPKPTHVFVSLPTKLNLKFRFVTETIPSISTENGK